MEVNVLRFNKKTLNSGDATFNSKKKMDKFKSLIPKSIGISDIIYIDKDMTYYCVKIFYTKKHVLKICECFKEVLTDGR